MQISKKTAFLVYTGMLSALAIVLYLFLEIPLFGGYLKIDFSDIPAAFAGVLLGPGAAVCVELIKNVIHLIVKGVGDTMGYGDLMNFLVGVALTVPFSAVIRRVLRKGRTVTSAALPAGAAGLIVMVAVGVIGNYLLAPLYFSMVLHFTLGGKALWAAIGSATLLNVIKSVLVAVVTVPIVSALRRYVRLSD